MRVFISYHTPDREVATRVAEGIKEYRPTAEMFFAPKTLSAGVYWQPRLAQEIKASHAVLLLIGKKLGPWQEREYLEAQRLEVHTGKPLIVPVVMGDYAPAFLSLINITACFFAGPRRKRL